MSSIIFENARILDGRSDEGEHDRFVRVADGLVAEVSDRPIADSQARRIDLRGHTLMPGLIDCHVHVVTVFEDAAASAALPDSLVALHAARSLKDMLLRGFTTVRDAGGADIGLQQAVEQGLIDGPRLVICGKALAQTGGHVDYRKPYDTGEASQNARLGSTTLVCDGVDACRLAARDELRRGAQFVKVMADGGAASSRFPMGHLAFSIDEMKAFVEEAENAETYVCGHLYSDRSIRRAVECGVLSVEHATMITPDTARMMKEKGAVACPTISSYEAQLKEAKALNLSADTVAKLEYVTRKSPESLAILRKAGVRMAYGTDLLGPLMKYQADEFVIRGRTLPAIEVIRSATSDAAALLRMTGKVGTVAAGAYADLIVLDGDPLADLSIFTDQSRMPVVMKGGRLHRNQLNA